MCCCSRLHRNVSGERYVAAADKAQFSRSLKLLIVLQTGMHAYHAPTDQHESTIARNVGTATQKCCAASIFHFGLDETRPYVLGAASSTASAARSALDCALLQRAVHFGSILRWRSCAGCEAAVQTQTVPLCPCPGPNAQHAATNSGPMITPTFQSRPSFQAV